MSAFHALAFSPKPQLATIVVPDMSINIDWQKLVEDETVEIGLKNFLDEQFCNLQLPSFIQSLRVSSLKLGTVGPEVTVRHISDPFEEFYESEDDKKSQDDEFELEEPPEQLGSPNETIIDPSPAIERINNAMGRTSTPPNEKAEAAHPKKSEFDLQTIVELDYHGDMELGVTATLLVNYPSPNFISLPLAFKVSGIDIHSLAVIAAIGKRISISILCDVDNNDEMSSESVRVIRTMKIQSKIGDSSHNGAVLHNVGRVEEFILVQLRKVVRDELVWPGWITLEL